MRLLADVRNFLETGGDVLTAILAVTFLMWTLIIERYWYLWTAHRSMVREVREIWARRRDTTSWYAHQIRRGLVSRVSVAVHRGVPLIKTLVSLCLLLGLLGTVTGMIEVFDVMALTGSSSPRAMASGVSRATIPTMAGMVAAISGFIFSVQLQRRADVETEQVADLLSPGK